jgi:cysteine desulfurase / selenocysteine lyase
MRFSVLESGLSGPAAGAGCESGITLFGPGMPLSAIYAAMATALEKQKPSQIDWAEVRARYPAALASVYFNIASSAVLSKAARAAAEEAVRSCSLGRGDKEAHTRMLGETRQRFAQLINGDTDEIAVVKNVSEGLNAVAAAIDWKKGDNVALCGEYEHPNNIYLWLALRERGVELRILPPRQGMIDADAMVAAIDARTRVVTASSVTFVPGFRTDLARIGRACRERGALFLVDAVQSAGVLEMDVRKNHIDALATSTSKGLLGVPGLGFLFVRREWAKRLRPAYIARYSIKREGHYSEFESYDFEWLPNAQRFEIGNYNWIGLAAAHASLGELLALGSAQIESHVVGLTEKLADGLAAHGLPVTSPPVRRSHLMTIGEMGSGDTQSTSDPRVGRFAAALEAAKVQFTMRRGMVRFGLHLYNDAADVARVVEIAGRI